MIRVLYAPRNISGQSSEYAAAVRALGLQAEVWSYGDTAYDFEVDRVVSQDRLLADPDYRWSVFAEAVEHFDVFHLQYGRSLLNPVGVVLPDLWDLPLLKSLGKRVFMHFRGSDVRLRSVHVQREADSYLRDSQILCDEERISGRISIARRFCDQLFVSTPGLLDYVPDAVWMPHTIDIRAWARPPRPERDIPVVVHLPSSRATKSSDHIDEVLRRLQAQGVCEYRPLQGLRRGEIPAAFQHADVVIDSLQIGDHGLVSVEAMAASAIAVAHIHERNRERNPGVPVVEATRASLEGVVRRLAADPEERARLRAEGEAWAASRHDHSVVGARLRDAYSAPPRRVTLAYPEWPRSDRPRRVACLEQEIERLRCDVDPLVWGFGRVATSLPRFVVDRLLGRVDELEQALRNLDPGHPMLSHPAGRRNLSVPRSLRDLVKEHPRVHLLARRLRRQVQHRGQR